MMQIINFVRKKTNDVVIKKTMSFMNNLMKKFCDTFPIIPFHVLTKESSWKCSERLTSCIQIKSVQLGDVKFDFNAPVILLIS